MSSSRHAKLFNRKPLICGIPFWLMLKSFFVLNIIKHCHYIIWCSVIRVSMQITIRASNPGLQHIKKFAEIWPSFTDLFTISCIVSIVLTLCTRISFHSKDEFQIRKYHEKEQLLANRMVRNEAQYTKTPLVIFTIKEQIHFQWAF